MNKEYTKLLKTLTPYIVFGMILTTLKSFFICVLFSIPLKTGLFNLLKFFVSLKALCILFFPKEFIEACEQNVK